YLDTLSQDARDGHDPGADQPQHAQSRRRDPPGRAAGQHRDAAGRSGCQTGGSSDSSADRLRPETGSSRLPSRPHGEPVMPPTEVRAPNLAEVYARLKKIADNARTFNQLVMTDAKIAQTPKEVIWTLNKAKLYRYVPVVPLEQRHKLPLFMVFAIMNRPHVL